MSGSQADAKPAEGAHLRIFEDQRPRLLALAWRMLGARSEAQDLVQALWLQWQDTPLVGLHEPAAYLTRMATHACIDQLRSAQRQREHYVGIWLPEPVLEQSGMAAATEHRGADPLAHLSHAEDVSTAFLLALERLTPLERAAFLLHDVFELPFDEVAARLGRDTAACRQLAARARGHVRREYVRCELDQTQVDALLQAFETSLQAGDPDALAALLCDEATLMSDGGGRVAAIPRPVRGNAAVARVLCGLVESWRRREPGGDLRRARINGQPGYLLYDTSGRLELAATLHWQADGRVASIHLVRNPDKLGASLHA
ncbi:RNA polymerase sigma factor SigJ [Ralstonia insidiosa]|uniref:Uncharacterized protein n=1 Tax=Ralstonia insidiosa TaxID=190721 RepID=A0A192A3N3_9RALS|nr:RNA polymerase sigma factor SigJ [Ralstonia insidiosa]ANJ74994.1 hypothetical protein A9Y76_20855 [Ralstonia insidiosa]KAB0468286.1 sigma-70 family RNA polymerase sigma factor [Ralstonia insidiosa]MBY4910987.1 RNA polymerase sigma factor SigJ [Ralstonia insidiosa]